MKNEGIMKETDELKCVQDPTFLRRGNLHEYMDVFGLKNELGVAIKVPLRFQKEEKEKTILETFTIRLHCILSYRDVQVGHALY
jgi:hypothetical protein